MEENKNLNAEEQEPLIITLTDEETGEDLDFEVIAKGTVDEKNYFALIPVDDDGDEYVILEYKEDGDEVLLVGFNPSACCCYDFGCLIFGGVLIL